MNIVTTLDQIKNNILELEREKNAIDKHNNEYIQLIKRGTCFLPYVTQMNLSFAPSRFVGYIDNKFESHLNNPDKDGRITNDAINKILGIKPRPDRALEQAYLQFCASIGVSPSKSGAFGVERKYWVTPDVLKVLECNAENEITLNPNLTETEKQQLINARIGQGTFRENIISMWGKCCVTGCDYISILRASHIKPWRDSNDTERLDKFNGLLLSPNIDVLFDKGLISFKDTGELLLSNLLEASTLKTLGISLNASVPLKEEHTRYMAWHRDNVFKNSEA